MAVKETGNGTTGDGKERQRKAPEPIKIAATHEPKTMLQVGASIPGDVYDKLVTVASAHEGAIDGEQLVRRFLNEEVQRAIFSHVGVDYAPWYAQYTEHRKASRQGAGAKGGTTKARTSVLAEMLEGDTLAMIMQMQKEGKSKEEIAAVLFAS